MKFDNINRSWEAPDGFNFDGVTAEGAYLRVVFRRVVKNKSTEREYSVVTIFINDIGREVFRTEREEHFYLSAPELPIPPAPLVTRRARFLNAVYLVLAGLQEMRKCLNKS